MKRTKQQPMSTQVRAKVSKPVKKHEKRDGDTSVMISTGSTLLDLAISGGRVRGGGIPSGIFVEIFGPSGSGKTVLLCEIAGNIRKQNGEVQYHDPEARLNKEFAGLFKMYIDEIDYRKPNTIPEVFGAIRNWKPDPKRINGIMADSLAALSTDLEMGKDEGDKMGMRRAKEFSEELRKTCRIIPERNFLMVASNQVRVNADGNQFTPKYNSPGGEAIKFYSSLRLRTHGIQKIKQEEKYGKRDEMRYVGVVTNITVEKSSVWAPFHTAPLTIYFQYGIDDIRENLKFLKYYSEESVYMLDNRKLHQSLEKSIQIIEEENAEPDLREAVIDLWEDIESKFKSKRKPK